MLARIEHRAGDHEAELKQARRLIVLQPRNRDALQALQRAAKCNGLELLARQLQTRLQAVPDAPITRFPLYPGPVPGKRRLPDDVP